jgi:hypothetical protein
MIILNESFFDIKIDQCIYLKVSESKVIFIILYVDDILLGSNDLGLYIRPFFTLFEQSNG